MRDASAHHGKESYHWRATSRKTKPAERQEHSDSSPPKDAVQRKRYRARPKKIIMTHEIYRQTAPKNSKNEETEVNKKSAQNNTTRTEEQQ